MAHAVPYEVLVFGVVYPLYDLKDEKYVRVSMQALCPVVSAADKAAKTDVVVNPINILRGLQQSVFVDDTLAKIAKSEAKCASITSGYINVSTDKKVEKWVRVEKSKDGVWTLATEKKKASNAKAAAKGASKEKNGKKAA